MGVWKERKKQSESGSVERKRKIEREGKCGEKEKNRAQGREVASWLGFKGKCAYGELVLKQSGSLQRLVGHADSGLRG